MFSEDNNRLRQDFVGLRETEHNSLMEAEKKLSNIGIVGKGRVIAVACKFLSESLGEIKKKKDGK